MARGPGGGGTVCSAMDTPRTDKSEGTNNLICYIPSSTAAFQDLALSIFLGFNCDIFRLYNYARF